MLSASASDHEHAPLHRDARARARIAPHHHRPAANRSRRAVPGITVDNHAAAHHRLGRAPSGAAAHVDVGPVIEAAAIIAHAAGHGDADRLKQRDSEVVPGVRVNQRDLGRSGLGKLAQPAVDGAGGLVRAVDVRSRHVPFPTW
jgi:hypothetical protein